MASFWDHWPAWEKMVLILAAALVLTVLAGLLKLGHQTWKTRKFVKVEVRHANYPEMTENRDRGREEMEIPFGVRAIESGVEVEGVWNSLNSSPASSAPSSPQQMGIDPLASAVHEFPRSRPPSLAIPLPLHPHHPSIGALSSLSRSSPKPVTLSSRDKFSLNGEVSRQIAGTMSARRLYQPMRSSGLRHSSADLAIADASESDGLSSSSRERQSSSSLDSNVSISIHDSETAKATRDLNRIFINAPHGSPRSSQYLQVPENSQPDLNSLTTHRESQAAEVGQLKPRSRPGSDRYVDSGNSSRCSSTNAPIIERHAQREGSFESENPFRTPQASQETLNDIYIQSPQSVRDSDRGNMQLQRDCLVANAETTPRVENVRCASTEPPSSKLALSHNLGKVVRKVNSGFEILRPGTLPVLSAETPDAAQMPAAQSKKSVRKLHKKPGPFLGQRRTSAFFESV